MDTVQAAHYLGVSVDWLRRHLHIEQIPYYKPANRYYFIKEQLDVWLETSCRGDACPTGVGKHKKRVYLV